MNDLALMKLIERFRSLDGQEMARRALQLVEEASTQRRTGRARRRWVVRRLAVWADEAATWGDGPVGTFLEAIDRALFRVLFEAVAEAAYVAFKRSQSNPQEVP